MKRKSKLTEEEKEATIVNSYETVVAALPDKEAGNQANANIEAEAKMVKVNKPDLVEYEPVSVALIEENKYSRAALRNIMAKDEFDIVIEEGYGTKMRDLLMNSHEEFPELIIVGGDTDFEESYEAVKWLKNNFYDTNIIYLSDTNNNEDILKILKLGITSIIFRRKYSPEEVLAEIHKIINEERKFVFDDHIIKIILDSLDMKNTEARPILPKNLTDRDKQIVRMIVDQMKSNEIAIALGLNVRTVEGLVNSIMAKFDTKSRIGLVTKAIRSGLLD